MNSTVKKRSDYVLGPLLHSTTQFDIAYFITCPFTLCDTIYLHKSFVFLFRRQATNDLKVLLKALPQMTLFAGISTILYEG